MEQSELSTLIEKVKNGQASEEEKAIVRHELAAAVSKLNNDFAELKSLSEQ